ncbi:hypothetical protein KGF54_001540 [Candida jiufengensis]|uniref:uncharacterized protein n=1 Tax=Candida jiufengensis TaxID=497108 RepID=UPI002223F97C|nr:uncharacterized protein KGF54_001540 [Candida jiufengensis]KAI5954979.1 hypothetical protein KGF54_001540 [Candida jiufengensis]
MKGLKTEDGNSSLAIFIILCGVLIVLSVLCYKENQKIRLYDSDTNEQGNDSNKNITAVDGTYRMLQV